MPESHFEILDAYCMDCHDSLSEEGEVNLEELSFDLATDIKTAETWQKVLNVINSGEMPPENKDQLSAEEKTAFLDDLSNQIVVARKILSDNGGEITLRRLNRREYAHTIEDLIGVKPDTSTLPDDQASSEYDTQGASLFFSSDQLEQYLKTARSSLKLALTPPKPYENQIRRIEPEEQYNPHYTAFAKDLLSRAQRYYAWREAGGTDDVAKEFGFLDGWQADRQLNSFHQAYPQVGKYLSSPENKKGAAMMVTIKNGMTQINLANLQGFKAGRYKVRVKAAAYDDAPDRFHYLQLNRVFDKSHTVLDIHKVKGSLRNPETFEFEFTHEPGTHFTYQLTKRKHQDRGDKNLWTEYRKKNGYGTPWGVWVDYAEIEGPFPIPADHGILFTQPKDLTDSAYYREVIARFAQRAFRGSEIKPEFLEKLTARFQDQLAQGKKPNEALIDPLSIILSSPSFLYMVESTADESTDQLTQQELAVRLAYFLWSSPPDQELLNLAAQGKLTDPEILAAQTDRLLGHPHADRFLRSFTYQWLEMERLWMFQFDGRQFPNFDNAVRESAGEEIYQTVALSLKEHAPISDLLKTDHIVVNDILAEYYGLAGVKGSHFRKVKVPKNSPRGGLLSTAAVMVMGSDGERSSPVERGVWVLRHPRCGRAARGRTGGRRRTRRSGTATAHVAAPRRSRAAASRARTGPGGRP
ncbi:MAG: DUF1592 domain-containing protein, partial [Verrucomicrobiota bacterium]